LGTSPIVEEFSQIKRRLRSMKTPEYIIKTPEKRIRTSKFFIGK
jgi:hypothetical protein